MPRRRCLDCRALIELRGSRCWACERRRDLARGTRNERGVGTEHDRQRRALIALAGPIERCPRCGEGIDPSNPITAHHTVPRVVGGRVADVLICRRCNSSIGDRV